MTIKEDQTGFTIMELMVAISVLSVLLLMSTLVLIGVGKLYSKGINMANVQDVTRNVLEDVTSAVQFSGQPMTGPTNHTYTGGGSGINVTAVCFGSIRYSYVTGFPSGNVVWPHLLYKDEMIGKSSCSPLDIGENQPTCDSNKRCLRSLSHSGSELAGANMHLAFLTVHEYNPQLYGIKIGLVFGFKSMFKTNGGGGLATNSDGNYICNNQTGQEYCATSTLKTLATQRIR